MATEKSVTDLVTVYVAQGHLRANVIRGLLESAGIPVILKYEAAGQAIGITVNGLGRVEIQVPQEWAQEANDLLTATPRSGEIFSVPPDVKQQREEDT
ncbi:MAG: DUF2007 domain-containing protein [Anaerolineae bacterium]|nr:DUF2007 domain-containing protein [Anaerolineae bacterium]